MNTYSHNHQSKGVYLHPAAYTAGALLRDGEAWDNRAYLRYELVLCLGTSETGHAEDSDGNPGTLESFEWGDTDGNAEKPEAVIPIAVDLGEIERILAAGNTPPRIALKNTETMARAMVSLFTEVAQGKPWVAGDEIPIPGNIGGSFGTSEDEAAKVEWELAGTLWSKYCDPLLARKGHADDDAIEASLRSAETVNNNEVDEVPSSRSRDRKNQLLAQALPKLAIEARKTAKFALSPLISEAVAVLIGERGQELTFADVDQKFIMAMINGIQGEMKKIEAKKKGKETPDPEVEGLRKKKEQIEKQMPLPLLQGLTLIGKGGENEVSIKIMEGIAELARISHGKTGGQKEKEIRTAIENNPEKFTLFQLSPTALEADPANTPTIETINYLMGRDWEHIFSVVFGNEEKLPATSAESSALSKKRSEKLREEFANSCKEAFKRIEGTSDILEIYADLPASATKIIAQHKEDWTQGLQTKKESFAQNKDKKVLVTKSNFPLYYTLDPHYQELFRILLLPNEQEKYLATNTLELASDNEVEERRAELETLLVRRLKDFAKYQLIASNGFDDLAPQQKVEIGVEFCNISEDVEQFCRRSEFDSRLIVQFLSVLGQSKPDLLYTCKEFHELNGQQKVQVLAAICQNDDDVARALKELKFQDDTYLNYFEILLGKKDPPLTLKRNNSST